MTIPPVFFDLIYYILILLFGINFTISGIVIRNDENSYNGHLLGFIIIRFFKKRLESKQNKFLLNFYSFNNLKYFTLIGGILTILGSFIAIIDSINGLFK